MAKKHRRARIATLVLFLFPLSCATIPPEAVSLNEEIGKSIASTQAAYVNLLNFYFEQRRQKIDGAMGRYRERVIEAIKAELPESDTEMPFDQAEKILGRLALRRDQLQGELEKTRILLFDQINRNHLQIIQANANITAILQSFVDVDKGLRSLSTRTFELAGIDLRLEDVTSLLDEQLVSAADLAGDVTGTYEKIRALFKDIEELQ